MSKATKKTNRSATAILQQSDNGNLCAGCIYEFIDNCPYESGFFNSCDFFNCEKHNCIYVLADVEPLNKESE